MSALGLDRDTPVTISQSGENFLITSGKTVGTGQIEGSSLQASLRPAEPLRAASTCGDDDSLQLTATIDAKASPRALSGTLSVASCPSCESVEFHAVKQGSTQKKGGQ
jgi:hypothetical protein